MSRSDSKVWKCLFWVGSLLEQQRCSEQEWNVLLSSAESAVHWYTQDHAIWALSGVRTIDYQHSIKVRDVWCCSASWLSGHFRQETFLAAELQIIEGEAFTGSLGTDGNNVYVRYLSSICLQRPASSHTSNYIYEFGGEDSEDLSTLWQFFMNKII